jgi:hypothetical protein
MNSNFYWIKAGMLIGLGIILGIIFALCLLPYSIFLGLFLIAACLIILLLGTGARYLGRVAANHKLRQGWADRAHR